MGRLPLATRVGVPLLALAVLPGTVAQLPATRPAPDTGSPPGRRPPATAIVTPAVVAARPGSDADWPGLPACEPTTVRDAADPTPAAGPTAGSAPGPDPASPPADPGGAWWRLDPVLDEAGWLTGQRLFAGRVAGGLPRTLHAFDLPAESFAAGPVLGRLVVGADDGRASRVALIDLDRSCRVEIATEAAIVRRAVLAPDGAAMYEFRLDRATRADAGVWRRDLGAADASRVLAPIEADERFGPTWSTGLSFDETGSRLIVESCAAHACRLRIIDLATGDVTLHADPDLGEVVGVVGEEVLVRSACPGLPCPVLGLDAAGATRVVLEEAGLAAVAHGPDGARLIAEHPDGRHVLVIEPITGAVEASVDLVDGQRIVPGPGRALSGIELRAPSGRPWAPAVTARDGRIGDLVPFRLLDPTIPNPADPKERLP